MSSDKPVTQIDVAQLAQVSTAVVSYVVNNGPRPVAPETSKRVLAAIEELGYRPSALGRALRLGTSSTYGLAITDAMNTFQAAMMQSMDQELRERGLSLLLTQAHGEDELFDRVTRDMVNRGVEGAIVLARTDDRLWTENTLPIPVVLMDRPYGIPGYATLGSDYFQGGLMATQHLVEHERRRIVPVFGRTAGRRKILRYSGYQAALNAAGLSALDPIRVAWTRAGGYQAGLTISAMDPLPDGIFCFSDVLGIGILHALQKRGIRVPEDIAVVSFDGTVSAEYSNPSLTSVTQCVPRMASAAVEALSRPRPVEEEHEIFPVTLSVRESCGCSSTSADNR